MKSYQLIGLMSGTSLDGLDIVHCGFNFSNNQWQFELKSYETIAYSIDLVEKLKNAPTLSAINAYFLDKELGKLYAACVNEFINKNKINKKDIDAIASHGQTIFHQPEKGLTVQIGCGVNLSVKTGIPVINDFRKKDVAHGGQGAPLVPIGDFSLFSNQAESFLNIGGFANISFCKAEKIVAFDISPGNLPLNKLANLKGENYDKNGAFSKKGELNFFLLDLLNELEFYKSSGPKSLGTEWLENSFYPLIKFEKEIENNLRTVVEHIAFQIALVLNDEKLKSVFITGGGALNSFLIERIKNYYQGEIVIPTKEIIEFKEAIIFAFLGALHLDGKANSLSTVTGASQDSVGGVYHKI